MSNSLKSLLKVSFPIVLIFLIGCGGDKGVGDVVVDTTPLPVPTDLTATTVSKSRIDLSWSVSADAVGYKIYRNGMFYRDVFSASTFQDLNLTSSTTYEYRVSAYDSTGNKSLQSALASATTMTSTILVGTSGYDGAQGVAVDGSGNIYVSGWTLGDLDGNTNAGVDDVLSLGGSSWMSSISSGDLDRPAICLSSSQTTEAMTWFL